MYFRYFKNKLNNNYLFFLCVLNLLTIFLVYWYIILFNELKFLNIKNFLYYNLRLEKDNTKDMEYFEKA